MIERYTQDCFHRILLDEDGQSIGDSRAIHNSDRSWTVLTHMWADSKRWVFYYSPEWRLPAGYSRQHPTQVTWDEMVVLSEAFSVVNQSLDQMALIRGAGR